MTLREALAVMRLVEIDIEARELELVGKYAERRKLQRAVMMLTINNHDWDIDLAFSP